MELVSIGLVSISTDLVSVTVPGGWLPLAELPWMPVCPPQGLWLKARCSPKITAHFGRHHLHAHLLAMSLKRFGYSLYLSRGQKAVLAHLREGGGVIAEAFVASFRVLS